MTKKNNQSRFTQSIKLAWNYVSKAVFGEPAKQRASSIYVNHNIADFTLTTGAYENWVQEAYKENETIHGALNLIINTFCEAQIRVTDKDNEFLDDHPMLDLINHINPQDTQKRFFKQLLLDMYLGDVAYIEKVFDRAGRVTELGLLRPDRVLIRTDPENFIDHYVYQVNGKQFRLEPNEVIAIQFIDPANRFKGFSPLKSLGKRIDEDNISTEHSMTLLQNRGQPGSIIQVPEQMAPEQAEAFARSWSNRFQGSKNGQTGVLFGGMTYTPFGMSMKDLDFTALKNISEAKILSTLRIPLQVYGGITGDRASTFNNMREARKQFWEQAIIPLQTLVEDALNNDPDLAITQDIVWIFDRSEVKALQEDVDALATRYINLYRSGLTTLNESRQKLGFDDLEMGDDLFSPFPSFSTEEVQEEGAIDNTDSKSLEKNAEFEELHSNMVSRIVPSYDVFCKEKETKLTETDSNDHIKLEIDVDSLLLRNTDLEQQMKELDENNLILSEDEWNDFNRWLDEEIEAKELDTSTKYLEIALKREALSNTFLFQIGRMISKQFRIQIKSMTDFIGNKNNKAVKSFELDRLENELNKQEDLWIQTLEQEALFTIGPLIGQSAEQASLGVGISLDIESDAIQRAIRANTFKFAKKVSKTSVKQVRRIIKSAFEEGKTLGQVKKDLLDLGNNWSEARVEMIARTETSRAANSGARLGYQKSGVVEKLIYTAILDSRTSELCQALNGKVVGINDPFLTEEEGFIDSKGKAWDLSYDGGVPEPPSGHPNCRSTIVPVVESL